MKTTISIVVGAMFLLQSMYFIRLNEHHANLLPQEEDRVVRLEKRVDRLEQLMFNAVSLSVFDAQRQLADARTRLDNSERLFVQGFITDAQVAQDRFSYERAQRELALAKAEFGGRKIASEIEVMQAKHNLRVAEERLRFSERLNVRGYSTQTDVQQDRQRVDLLTKELQLAQDKLKAVSEMLEDESKERDADN